jgi:hypothetical protein
MHLCDFHCTQKAVGEPADSFITDKKKHAPRQFPLHPGSRRRDGKDSLQKKDKDFFEDPHDN